MWKRILIGLIVLFIIAQFVPRTVFPISNPGIDPARTVEARLQVPQDVDQTLKRACFDCHSNQTNWRWYSKVAPFSWLMSDDVSEGRRELNFSDWARFDARRENIKLAKVCQEVKEGDMPLWYYKPLHPEAKLSDADRQMICNWAESERNRLASAPKQ